MRIRPGLSLALHALASLGCSLGNVSVDRCRTDDACASAFGPGSTCDDGYCTAPTECSTTAKCREAFGFGAVCVEGRCATAPAEPRCNLSEPPELAGQFPTTVGDRILVGALLKDTANQNARATAMRHAVMEINGSGGINGKPLGLLVCRNDATDTSSENDETKRLVDYLGGDLGVPLILGPASSSNVTAALSTVLDKKLATTVISPSATAASLTDQPIRFGDGKTTLFWRTCPKDTLQSRVLASEVAKETAGRLVIVYQNDPYGNGIQSAFVGELDSVAPHFKNGIELATFRLDANLDADLAKAADKVKGKDGAPVVFVASDAAHTLKFFDALVKLGVTPPKIFLSDGSRSLVLLADTLSQPVRDLVKLSIGTGPAPFDKTDEGAAADYESFRASMKSLYDVSITSFGFVSHSYDAAYVGAYGLIHAYTRGTGTVAGFDGFDVADGLKRLVGGTPVAVGQNDFKTASNELTGAKSIDVRGISGPLEFDPNRGEAPGPIEIWRANATFDDFEQVSIVKP